MGAVVRSILGLGDDLAELGLVRRREPSAATAPPSFDLCLG